MCFAKGVQWVALLRYGLGVVGMADVMEEEEGGGLSVLCVCWRRGSYGEISRSSFSGSGKGGCLYSFSGGGRGVKDWVNERERR